MSALVWIPTAQFLLHHPPGTGGLTGMVQANQAWRLNFARKPTKNWGLAPIPRDSNVHDSSWFIMIHQNSSWFIMILSRIEEYTDIYNDI